MNLDSLDREYEPGSGDKPGLDAGPTDVEPKVLDLSRFGLISRQEWRPTAQSPRLNERGIWSGEVVYCDRSPQEMEE